MPRFFTLCLGLIGCFVLLSSDVSIAWAGTYRVEILLDDGVGFTEPQAWANAFGKARSGSIQIRQARGNETIEIRNNGTDANPELVIVGRLQADGRLRLPDGTHSLADAATLVATFEKLAHPELSSPKEISTADDQTERMGNVRGNTSTSNASATDATTVDSATRTNVRSKQVSQLPYQTIFAQPVGFATDKMGKSEVLQKIAENWKKQGVSIGGLQSILQTMQEQETAETEKRAKFAEAMGDISERRLAGETLDVQEELAKIYGYAPKTRSNGQNGNAEIRAAIPTFQTIWNAPNLESLASGTAVTYLLRSAGFALEIQADPTLRLEIVSLRLPAPADQSVHVVGYELSAKTLQNPWVMNKIACKTEKTLVPKLGQNLTITRLDKVPLDSLLANLAKKLELPILIDYAALHAKAVVLDQKPVSLPASDSTYRQTINDAIKPLQLRAVLRVDDAGEPFLWITTGFVKYP